MGSRLFIIGIQEDTLESLKVQMEYIFGATLMVSGVTLKDLTYESIRKTDVVLLSSPEIHPIVKPFLHDSCRTIAAKRTVNIVKLKELMHLEAGSKFMVVNDNPSSTRETCDDLKNVLPGHNFFPYRENELIPEDVDYIVTPGETGLIPAEGYKTFDIGPRVISIETVMELEKAFHIHFEEALLMQYYIRTMVQLTEKRSERPGRVIENQNKKRTFEWISTKSPLMEATLTIARQMARGSHTLHITGTAGAGKQMLAEMIHNASSYNALPFYVYSTADKDPLLIENELFGKNGGEGALNEIIRGTLYIKNVESLPYQLQNRLADFLEKSIDNSEIRLMTSSNEDLKHLYDEDIISSKLHLYLSPHILSVPSLAERKEDIPILIDGFKKHFEREDLNFSKEAMDAFTKYAWPGNVRELYNLISYCVCLDQHYIDIDSLPIFFKGNQNSADATFRKGQLPDSEEIVGKIEKHGFLSESIKILKVYQAGKQENVAYGRGRVRELLNKEGINMTDQQLRLRIDTLNQLGLLNVRVGRAGTTISEKGEQFLDEQN